MGSLDGVVSRLQARLRRVWGRVGRRSDGRAPIWIELLVIAWLFWLYDVVNSLAPVRQLEALSNGRGLISAERSLGLDPELTLNHWLAAHHTLGLAASYYYFFAHGVVTAAVLILLWWKDPRLYIRQRTQLVIINLIGFLIFWRYPLAPPRLLGEGFVDVVAASHAFISWHSGVLAHDADQLAAMPSLHVAWAIWSGVSLWQLYRRRLVAALAVLYPLTTTLVVMATGNHYLFDVAAGAGCVPAAYVLYRAGSRWLSELLARRRAAPTGGLVREDVLRQIELAVLDPAAEPAGAAESPGAGEGAGSRFRPRGRRSATPRP